MNRNFLASSKNNLNNREQPVKGSGGVARPDFSHMVPYAPLPSSSECYGTFHVLSFYKSCMQLRIGRNNQVCMKKGVQTSNFQRLEQ